MLIDVEHHGHHQGVRSAPHLREVRGGWRGGRWRVDAEEGDSMKGRWRIKAEEGDNAEERWRIGSYIGSGMLAK